MGAQGRIIIDFGPAPGATDATVAVTGQAGILSSSLAEAWIDATAPATPDHNPDEHSVIAAEVGVTCQNIVPGTGFTIYVVSNNAGGGAIVGKVNMAWVWA